MSIFKSILNIFKTQSKLPSPSKSIENVFSHKLINRNLKDKVLTLEILEDYEVPLRNILDERYKKQSPHLPQVISYPLPWSGITISKVSDHAMINILNICYFIPMSYEGNWYDLIISSLKRPSNEDEEVTIKVTFNLDESLEDGVYYKNVENIEILHPNSVTTLDEKVKYIVSLQKSD